MLTTSQRMAAKLAEAISSPPIKQSTIAAACGVTKQAVQGWIKTGRFDKKHLPKLALLTNRPLQWWLEIQDPLIEESREIDRLENLRTFLEHRGVDYLEDEATTVLSELLGQSFEYCDALLSGKIALDVKLAREIERKLGMAAGDLDKPLPPFDADELLVDTTNQTLIDNLQDWRLKASTKSQEVIDQLTLLAKKNMLRDEDWLLIEQITHRLNQR